jgi:hypothetical protein
LFVFDSGWRETSGGCGAVEVSRAGASGRPARRLRDQAQPGSPAQAASAAASANFAQTCFVSDKRTNFPQITESLFVTIGNTGK